MQIPARHARTSPHRKPLLATVLASIVFTAGLAVAVSALSVAPTGEVVEAAPAANDALPVVQAPADGPVAEDAITSDDPAAPVQAPAALPADQPSAQEETGTSPAQEGTGEDAQAADTATADGTQASGSEAADTAQAATGFDPSTMGSSGVSNLPAWQAINSDVKGWLRVPNTNINYPVVYYPDTNYYLSLDYYKNYSKNGVIWADQEAQPGNATTISRNTVLYGHNWTNYSATPRIGNAQDVMFAQLTAFHYLDFAQKTPYIYYSTGEQEMTWVVFAAFYTDIDFMYILCNPDDTNFVNIVNGARLRSRHNYDVEIAMSDKILTLSTCTRAYGQSDRQRFVVMARLLRPDEEIKPITITANPNPVLPQNLW